MDTTFLQRNDANLTHVLHFSVAFFIKIQKPLS